MDVALLDHSPMAKKKMGRPPKGRNDVTAKIDATVLSRAKVVAGLMNKTIAEYLSESMSVIVEKDLAKQLGKLKNSD